MFKELTGRYFYHNGSFKDSQNFDPLFLRFGYSFYEVIRVIEKNPVFLNDHIDRFRDSLLQSKNPDYINSIDFKKITSELILRNNISEGNIKMVINFGKETELFVYFIPHRYPQKKDYRNGVKVLTEDVERKEPAVKAVNLFIRELTENIMVKKKVYEVLLVDRDKNITEGSKSNIFFVKGNKVFTPPVEKVLPGITRKYVIKICREASIEIEEKNIPLEGVGNFDAVFLTGTSPKVLPVRQINGFRFDAKNEVIWKIAEIYNQTIQDEIKGNGNIVPK